MTYIQEYPLKTALPKIARHNQLPSDAIELARLQDTADGKDLYTFVQRSDQLSILVSYVRHLKTGDKYGCKQYDFPLKVLSWFPKALADFQKPPAEGGLHAGAMTSADEDVDGEMLCVQSTIDGYALVNRSRQSPLGFEGSYEPTDISLSYHLLYDLGLLDLWQQLGEQYERGEL
ncbi:MAG: hypothetical protein ACR2PX_16820 [Endozoicomonas sp.]|uniref:hypothetical protein n=1 Tax=Endozoicomonas sp. TaxID=1892382 RepID=UPI003D9B58AA